MEIKVCPACRQSSERLVDWQFSGVNESVFNYTAEFFHCLNCGLVYIDNICDEQLTRFYSEECSYFENAHFDIYAPGNISKYSFYHNILVKNGMANVPVTDVGCGRGGYLLWLNANGWQADCLGVDLDTKSIPFEGQPEIERWYSVRFQQGGARSLPCSTASQQLMTYFHVFEHIRDTDSVLDEAHRVLAPNGKILIEVPDAENYSKQPIGSAFWIGIREHVYHFSARALIAALKRHGFTIVTVQRTMAPTPDFDYPSLILLAKHGGAGDEFDCAPGTDIAPFVRSSRKALLKQAEQIIALAGNHSPITFWGCSTELWSLLPLLGNLDFRLCDASHVKQQCRYQGRRIHDPNHIKPEGILIVAPYLHADSIEQAAIVHGWAKEAIIRLQ
jgi:2-polyprenyl-3-methyl-5-hydroxy-6-metoxy-1,4-benzoquinol methylase